MARRGPHGEDKLGQGSRVTFWVPRHCYGCGWRVLECLRTLLACLVFKMSAGDHGAPAGWAEAAATALGSGKRLLCAVNLAVGWPLCQGIACLLENN